MDKFELEKLPPEQSVNFDPTLAFRVVVNGELLHEEDYCLEIDSFFNSVGVSQAQLTFIGGCGVPECCAVGSFVRSQASNWTLCQFPVCWTDFQISWSDVLRAAKQIISAIEQLPLDCYEYRFFENLPTYREKTETLEKLVRGASVSFTRNKDTDQQIENIQSRYSLSFETINHSLMNVADSAAIADMALYFIDHDHVDIGLVKTPNLTPSRMLFDSRQLLNFLPNECRRKLLLACFSDTFDSDFKLACPLESYQFEKIVFCKGSSDQLFDIRRNNATKVRLTNPDFCWRSIKCSVSLDKFSIGLNGGYGWNPHLRIEDSSEIWLSKFELASFLSQDTQRNGLHFVLPYATNSTRNDIRALSEEFGFTEFDIGYERDAEVRWIAKIQAEGGSQALED